MADVQSKQFHTSEEMEQCQSEEPKRHRSEDEEQKKLPIKNDDSEEEKREEQEIFDMIGEQMYNEMMESMMKEIHLRMEEDRKKCFKDFHDLLDKVVEIVKRNVCDPSDSTIHLEYYTKVLEIAREMRDNFLFFCRSSGGIDWYKRFVRLRPKMGKNDLVKISPEAAEKEKELIVVVDELIDKHAPLYDKEQRSDGSKAIYYPAIVPFENYDVRIVHECLFAMMKEIAGMKSLGAKIMHQWSLNNFAIHYSEEFLVYKDIDLRKNLTTRSEQSFDPTTRSVYSSMKNKQSSDPIESNASKFSVRTPIHAVIKYQEALRGILMKIKDNIKQDPESSESDHEFCDFHLASMNEFQKIFAPVLEIKDLD
ncbi:Hypothetical protein HVR_LOCUS1158 [uncultured virus]|nr:Hypothetical protein HVR_LOCUS1158 [uncultured virus]